MVHWFGIESLVYLLLRQFVWFRRGIMGKITSVMGGLHINDRLWGGFSTWKSLHLSDTEPNRSGRCGSISFIVLLEICKIHTCIRCIVWHQNVKNVTYNYSRILQFYTINTHTRIYYIIDRDTVHPPFLCTLCFFSVDHFWVIWLERLLWSPAHPSEACHCWIMPTSQFSSRPYRSISKDTSFHTCLRLSPEI